ncbi:MAG: cytochrome c [Proteobacteria bacterium]|nr:cytochrome c [Pseudomonadota bacterium]
MLLLLLSACGGGQPAPTPRSTTAVQEEGVSHEQLAQEGKRLFLTTGCATCHGQEAAGSAIAPALAGHTAEQVRRQVRSPIGSMPRYSPDRLGGEALGLLLLVGQRRRVRDRGLGGFVHHSPRRIALRAFRLGLSLRLRSRRRLRFRRRRFLPLNC